MIQVHEKKLARQMLGLQKWKEAGGRGTFWWETGMGKTYAALVLCKKMLSVNNSNTFIILVPGTDMYNQWWAEIKSNIATEFHDNFRIFTVHKFMETVINEYNYVECSLTIVDEIHEFYSEERLKIFFSGLVVSKYWLGLTADYEDSKNRHFAIQEFLPVIDRISPEEATKEGFTSKFIEYNLGIQFTEGEKEKYRIFSDQISKSLSKFSKGLDLAQRILNGDKDRTGPQIAFAYAVYQGWRKDLNLSNPIEAQIHELWAPNKIMGYAKTAMDSIRDRKSLVYCAINKIKYARDLAIKFEDLKTIFFSQSTAFADILARTINKHYENDDQLNHIPCVVYHSKIQTITTTNPVTGKQKKKGKTVLKREAIEAIKSGKARRISTASSLDRGFDVKDIRMGVTTSGTQNPTQHHQRSGRPKRIENYEEDITVLIINLYIKDSIDEKWLRNRQSKSDNVVYWVDSINDINYTPKRKEMFNLIDV